MSEKKQRQKRQSERKANGLEATSIQPLTIMAKTIQKEENMPDRLLKAAAAYVRLLKARHSSWTKRKLMDKAARHFNIKFV